MIGKMRESIRLAHLPTLSRNQKIRPVLRSVPALLLAIVVVGQWSTPEFLWNPPPLWAVILALVALTLGIERVPIWALAWWLLGLVSLSWTLTPGTTLVAVLWALVYTSAWAASGGAYVLGASLVIILVEGVFSTISLQSFGMAQYFSGSIEYLTGAIGLLILPFAWQQSVRCKGHLLRIGSQVVSAIALLAALTSGARAVYLPLLFVAPVVVVREFRGSARRSALAAMVILSLVGLANAVIPGNPVGDAVGIKIHPSGVGFLTSSASRATEPNAANPVKVEGGIGSRLKMWDQTVRVGLTHPLGTGLGSFRDVIVGFQRYPTVNFSSAHNALLEIFATQGWVGLGLVLYLLSTSVAGSWRRPHLWPFAVGSAAIWCTMLFDVTWSMPEIPLLAFWSLSVGRGAAARVWPAHRRVRWVLHGLVPVVGIVVVAWWYVPCDGASCVMKRHLGFSAEASALVQRAPAFEQRALLENLKSMYPRSIWVWSLERAVATSPSAQIQADQELISRFPLASPSIYLALARLQFEQGNDSAARHVLNRGLDTFPPGLVPAGVPLVSNGQSYETWIADARSLMQKLGP